MRKSKIDSAGVNVERFAEISHGHGRTLDVPAGPSSADFRFPEMLAGFWRLPESKIARALFFVTVVVNASAGLDSGEINFGELSVLRKFGNAVVDRAFAIVGKGF